MNKYFKILLLIFGLTCSMNGYAQLKDGILFQAVARDASGNAASNRDIYVKIFVLKATSTGEVVYAETFQVRSTDEGVFSIVIGNGTRIAGVSSLSLIDWRTSIYFLNLKIAIAPTLPTPGWNYENEYVDQGTAQFWSVPYSLFSNRSITADSAFTITTLLPGSKGGTGVINEGKTITLDGNLKIAGTGNVTLTNKGNTNITLPLSGKLVTDISFDTLQNKILTSPKLIGNPIAVTPDISSKDSSIATTGFVATLLGLDKKLLNLKIDSIAAAASSNNEEKLNITDTASMLSLRFARDTASLSNRINLKLNLSDTSIMLANRFARDTASLSKRIDKISASSGELSTGKLNISDTSFMLSNRFNRDTASLSNRINSKLGIAQFESEISKYLDSVQVLKLSDTAAMLSNRFARDTVSLSNRINVNKQAIIDSASALNTRINTNKQAIIDSASALNTRISTNKQAIIDSATALNIRKVNVSDTAAMLSSRFARDTVSLSNRINTNKQAIIDSSSALNTRINTNKQAIIDSSSALDIRKVNVSDTAAMLSNRFTRDTVSLSNRINTNKQVIIDNFTALNSAKVNISDTSLMLSNRFGRDTVSLSNRINTNKQALIDSSNALDIRKVNVSDTSAMLSSRFSRDTVSLSTRINTNKQAIIDSASALDIRKVNVSDTSAMLSSRFARDTVSLSTRINTNKQAIIDSASALNTRIDTNKQAIVDSSSALNIRKVNVSDTSAMLSNRFARDTVSLSNRINTNKQAIVDSATALDIRKVNVSDTSAMLTSRFARDTASLSTRIDINKLAIIDSASALNTRKVNVSDTSAMLSSRFARDTVALSNRIDINMSAIIDSASALNTRKVNVSDTAAMLSSRFERDTASLSARINLKVNTLNAVIDTLLTVYGKAKITDTLVAKGNVLIDSNLFVKGKTTLTDTFFTKGNVLIDSNLFVKGINVLAKSNSDSLLFVNRLIDSVNALNIRKVNVSDTAAMLSSRFARDTVSLSDRINLKVNTLNAVVQNSLTVNGKIAVTDSLTVMGLTRLNDSLNVKGRVQLDSTLYVNKVASLNDSLYVKGKVMLDSSLYVKGKTTISDSLVVKGFTKFYNSLSIDAAYTFPTGIIVGASGLRNDGRNTAVGFSVLNNNIGWWDEAFGNSSLSNNTTGSFNSAYGGRSLYSNSTGSGNVSFGFQSLYNNLADSNAAFGYNAGLKNTTGFNNTFIGNAANADSVNLFNATAIGAGSIVKNSNTIQLGNSSLRLVNTYGSINSNSTIYANKLYAYDSLIVKGSALLNSNLNISGVTSMQDNLIIKGTNILSKINQDSAGLNRLIIDSASSLNARINTNKQAIIDSATALNIRKVNVSDTSAMLTSRFARDTVSLSTRINTNKQALIDSSSALDIRKVNVSDTSAMLSSRFARDTVSLSNRINQLSSTTSSGKVSVTDTATMLTNYARKLTSNINVKLSTGKYLGKYTNGDVIPAAGKTLDELMFDIATETIHPTYVSPTVSISSSPTSGDYEIGSTITPITLSNTFVKNDGGNSTSITYQKNNSNIGSNVDGITNITTTQTFRVVVNYGIGAVKNNNLNVADSVGIITAGSVTSGLISFAPKSKRYWGVVDNSSLTDANILSGNSEFSASRIKSEFTILVSGSKYVYYAYPVSDLNNNLYGLLDKISIGGFTSTDTFTHTIRNVTNAQGYTQSYHIYISNNNFSANVENIIFN